MTVPPPTTRPNCPNFSSGPCAKRPGWSAQALAGALLGRSHRAPACRDKLAEVIHRSRTLLNIPTDWRVAIVPGSDTGAVEMALWSLLGPNPVDILAFDSFSAAWATDVTAELRLPAARILAAEYGHLPDLAATNPAHDLVFAWNGTTSGVRIPGTAWLEHRTGLAICDATSAVFAMDLPWPLLDVVTWSWQKALGGEAAHGMLALSPRAAERLRTHTPAWPIPRLFRLARSGALTEPLFAGDTINTPSMLCVEDALDSLRWAHSIGGLPALIARSQANLAQIERWVAARLGVRFLAADPATRSSTAICLAFDTPATGPAIAATLDTLGIAHDIASHRDAPPGLRIWGGATVDAGDIEKLLPWIDHAWTGHGGSGHGGTGHGRTSHP